MRPFCMPAAARLPRNYLFTSARFHALRRRSSAGTVPAARCDARGHSARVPVTRQGTKSMLATLVARTTVALAIMSVRLAVDIPAAAVITEAVRGAAAGRVAWVTGAEHIARRVARETAWAGWLVASRARGEQRQRVARIEAVAIPAVTIAVPRPAEITIAAVETTLVKMIRLAGVTHGTASRPRVPMTGRHRVFDAYGRQQSQHTNRHERHFPRTLHDSNPFREMLFFQLDRRATLARPSPSLTGESGSVTRLAE